MSLKSLVLSSAAIDRIRQAVHQPLPEETDDGFPDAVVDWLARLRLLMGVPFAYLVPDERLLPVESIRFFYVNRNWTDAAIDGAMSVGAVTTRDRALVQALHAELRAALDRHERRIWSDDAGAAARDGAGEVLTGFLLRSRAVSGWPGLHVRALRAGQPVGLLRMERLAPAVLLVLLDGVPDRVEIEEPRAGIQFGVDPPGAGQPPGSRWITVRTPATGDEAGVPQVPVPFRAGAPGVLHVTELAQRLQATHLFGVDGVGAGELALQLLQFPYQQPFGTAAGGIDRVFRTTIAMSVVKGSARVTGA